MMIWTSDMASRELRYERNLTRNLSHISMAIYSVKGERNCISLKSRLPSNSDGNRAISHELKMGKPIFNFQVSSALLQSSASNSYQHLYILQYDRKHAAPTQLRQAIATYLNLLKWLWVQLSLCVYCFICRR